jgi:WD repeat-containing protein 48
MFGFRGVESSIYSSACDDSGLTIFAGGSDGGIYVLDMRTGRAEAHLTGHRHGVRALLTSGDGTAMVSGGSDHTAKIWDIGQRSVLQTLAMHTDSVWCLDGGPERDVSVLYSGGRDGCVYKTDTKSLSCEMVVNLGKPVTCLKTDVLQDKTRAIWVGSTISSVQCYLEKPDSDSSTGECFSVGSLPSLRERKRFDSTGKFHPRPTCGTHPDLEIQGVASVVEVKALTDKRHLLTKDSDGNVDLWDVSQASIVDKLGTKASIKDAEREMFDPTQSALTWFQPDSSLGVVAGQLSPSSCFSCEAYVKHFGYPEAPPDEKINMAVEMLKELLKSWKVGYLRNNGRGKEDTFEIEGIKKEEESDSIFHFATESSPAVIVSGDAHSLPWKKRCSEMDGTEDIPLWAAKCVLDGKYPISKALKMSFILCPRKGSNLPPMQQSKLSAPRVLEVEKITDYVMKKLTGQGYDLVKEPVFWSVEKQAQWGSIEETKESCSAPDDGSNDAGIGDRRGFTNNLSSAINYGMKHFRSSSMDQSQNQNNALLLTCNGMVVPWDFTLAAVRQWMWKRPEDLKIEYSIRNFDEPLKVPTIKIPI